MGTAASQVNPTSAGGATAAAGGGSTMTDSEAVERRHDLFKKLPVRCSGNDMVYGSWWMVWGSLFASLIPVMPLISVNLAPNQEWWPPYGGGVMSVPSHSAVYVLLSVGCGLFFAVGSYLLLRSYRRPQPPPLLTACGGCLPTDEVHSLWWFTVGTAVTIPCTAIYVYYFPKSHEFSGACFVCCFATVLSVLFTITMYPSSSLAAGSKQRLAPYLHSVCFGPGSTMHVHVKTDILIVFWVGLWGCVFGTVGCVVLLAYYIYKKDGLGIFNYVTGGVDLVLFLVGSLYYLAGSYADGDVEDVRKGKDDAEAPLPAAAAAGAAPSPPPLWPVAHAVKKEGPVADPVNEEGQQQLTA